MCLLLAEAVEDDLMVHAEARTHQQRLIPGAEGGEGGWRAAGNLWRAQHTVAGWGGTPPAGPPGLLPP